MDEDPNRTQDEIASTSEKAADKPKTRGATTGKRSKDKPKGPIEFDENDVPIGPYVISFASDMGIHARNVKITYETWAAVPKEKKHTIWLQVMKDFEIKDPKKKKLVLKLVGSRFRDHKSMLRGVFIYKTRKPSNEEERTTDPCQTYGILKEEWLDFAKQAMDPEFMEKSRKARENQKKNEHPHYMGRAGYGGKKEHWLKEEIEKEKVKNPDADTNELEEIVKDRISDRSYKWIKGHTPATSDPPPQTQEMIKKIHHWKELEEKGEFVPDRLEDVLVKATGKKEHTGRTRGVGSFVGNQKYFGKPPREKVYTSKEVEALKVELKKEYKAEMMSMFFELAKSNGLTIPENFGQQTVTHPSPVRESHSTCHSVHDDPKDPFKELKDPVPCRLAADDKLVVVAEGTVMPWKEDKTVHNKRLSQENGHVSIDKALDSSALLPVPWPGFTTVGSAEGSFAEWPKKWILFTTDEQHEQPRGNKKAKASSKKTTDSRNKVQENDNERETESRNKTQRLDDMEARNIEEVKKAKTTVEESKKKSHSGREDVDTDIEKEAQNKDDLPSLSEDDLKTLGPFGQRLEGLLASLESKSLSAVSIDIDKCIYNYTSSVTVFLSRADIRQMFKYEWLNVTVLQVWGRFLYDFGTSIGTTKDSVGFFCPAELSMYVADAVGMENYVQKVLKFQQDKRYVMGAFHTSDHWMLVVIAPRENKAYILDSLKSGKRSTQIRKHLRTAWKLYSFVAGTRDLRKRNELKVVTIECPQQPGGYECGYYVMKWMYDITLEYCLLPDSLDKCLSQSRITVEELNQVRELWCQNFTEHMDSLIDQE